MPRPLQNFYIASELEEDSAPVRLDTIRAKKK